MQQPKANTSAQFVPTAEACKKKTTHPNKFSRNKYTAGFSFKHIMTTFGLIQERESKPNKEITQQQGEQPVFCSSHN